MNSYLALSPDVVDNLLDLRMLVERGTKAAQLGSPADENLAVVILDGANERAALIAASEFSTKVDNSFEGNLSRVAQAASSRGTKLPGVGDVIKLHKARNGVQHHGIKVNRGQLSLWASTTQAFVRALVDHLYGIDILKVWRGDAIHEIEIRDLFVQAERLLDKGDVHASIEKAYSAFSKAREQWARQRRRLAGSRPSRTGHFRGSEILGRELWQEISGSISDLDDYSEVQPFAEDMGEYIWLTSIRREPEFVLGVQDANRVLNFVFWWIVRWETFSQTVVLDRREQWLKSQRLVRPSDDLPASVAGVDIRGRSTHGWRVEIQLKDVPPEAEFREWAHHVLKKLGQQIGVDRARYWDLREDGYLCFESFLETDLDQLAQDIRETLEEALSELIQRRKDVEDHRKRIKDREEQLWASIEERVPSWLTAVSLEENTVARGVSCVLKISSEVPSVGDLSNKIRGDLLVEQCLYVGMDGIAIYPELSSAQLLEVLDRVSAYVDARKKERLESDLELAKQKQESLLKLRSSFAIE
ncbi:hypothetical protein [Microbispora sp. H11081]|uniref:hypothetical protein n=1 Tax=Microbispora sp. H11081 TaxID=2729107 RepID=UPI001475F414|nr:hypothetical protein [Microbispora sp. H11081]